jgi:hypothetical protein
MGKMVTSGHIKNQLQSLAQVPRLHLIRKGYGDSNWAERNMLELYRSLM